MNPALGVFFHWLGGLASASFYALPRGEALGLGNLLARWRILKLDYCPMYPRAHDYSQPHGCPA